MLKAASDYLERENYTGWFAPPKKKVEGRNVPGKVHLVIPDSHAHPDYNNNRADWLGELIADVAN